MNALIIVDVQNDFLPGGALAVPEGDQVISIINALIPKFDLVVATQDWHPADHGSFAINHKDKKPGELINLNGLNQILWPVHCVQNSDGAQLAEDLNQDQFNEIFVKGTDPGIDSYSGFFDNGHKKATGLADYLHHQKMEKVYVVGLATDYCVKFTALDAIREGFEVYLFEDATKAVNLQDGDFESALLEMKEANVQVIHSADFTK